MELGIINFWVFLAAGILLNLTPGSDTMYILSRSISNGKKAGVLSALRISTGSLIHTIFAAFGLSILLAESQTAFIIVKYMGAAYLVFLGIKAIFTKSSPQSATQPTENSVKGSKVYLSGILTNVLNPKVALFYLAFLPQFIEPDYSFPYISFILLGITFTVTGTIWCLLLAVFSSSLSGKIRRNYKIKLWLDRITGVVFISLGIKLASGKN